MFGLVGIIESVKQGGVVWEVVLIMLYTVLCGILWYCDREAWCGKQFSSCCILYCVVFYGIVTERGGVGRGSHHAVYCIVWYSMVL